VSGGYPDQQGEPAASGSVVVPVRLVQRWARAYRQYGQASTRAARSAAGDRPAARAVAATSRAGPLSMPVLRRGRGWCLAATSPAGGGW